MSSRLLDDLTNEELVALAQSGDRSALDALCTRNKEFLFDIAWRIPTTHLTLEDKVQSGYIGFLTAVEKFDSSRGVRFTSYAGFWVRQAIQRAVNDQERMIRIPAYMLEEAQRLQQWGHLPSCDKSLDEPLSTEDERTFEDTLIGCRDQPVMAQCAAPVEDQATRMDWPALMRAADLTTTQCKALALTYGLEDDICRSTREVAPLLNCSHEQVRKWLRRGVEKLREYMIKEDYAEPITRTNGDAGSPAPGQVARRASRAVNRRVQTTDRNPAGGISSPGRPVHSLLCAVQARPNIPE